MRIILALDFEGMEASEGDYKLSYIKSYLRTYKIPFYESPTLQETLDEIECIIEKK